MTEPRDTVARVDADALQREALSAIAAASTPAELEELRIRYLGRNSPLKLALREVRDRETGMALNAAREAIESAVSSREAALERAELDRALTEDVVDVTLPGERLPLGHLHPITQARREIEDAFLGLGYEVRDDREVETTEFNFDKLAFDPWHPARSHRRRSSSTRTGCSEPRPRPRRFMRWRNAPRRSTWSRSAAATGATRSMPRTTRSSTSSRVSPSTATSRSPTSRERSST